MTYDLKDPLIHHLAKYYSDRLIVEDLDCTVDDTAQVLEETFVSFACQFPTVPQAEVVGGPYPRHPYTAKDIDGEPKLRQDNSGYCTVTPCACSCHGEEPAPSRIRPDVLAYAAARRKAPGFKAKSYLSNNHGMIVESEDSGKLCEAPDCDVRFTPKRVSARYCSARCRVRAKRAAPVTLTAK